MKLTWYGQAAFLIEDMQGFRIVCDPYNPELLGFPPIADECDLVITSSANDEAHCRHDRVPGTHLWVNALDVARDGGSLDAVGRTIRAIESMEMENHPTHDPEQNAMYRFVVDGLHVAHMGDIGNPLNERQLAFLDDVDVLLALAGGEPVVTLDELMRVLHAISPKIVVPMHYRTALSVQPGLLPLDDFLVRAKGARLEIDMATSSVVDLQPSAVGRDARVLVVPQHVAP